MAIRLPLTTVGNFTTSNEVGAGSVNGIIAYPFQAPTDTDGLVVKFTASCVGAGAGYSVFLQTSDDGGTTYYDVAQSSVVTNANNTTAEWIAAPVFGTGMKNNAINSNNGLGSVAGRTTGTAAASSLGVAAYSGLPILGIQNQVAIKITGNVTSAASNATTIKVYANSQSASHN